MTPLVLLALGLGAIAKPHGQNTTPSPSPAESETTAVASETPSPLLGTQGYFQLGQKPFEFVPAPQPQALRAYARVEESQSRYVLVGKGGKEYDLSYGSWFPANTLGLSGDKTFILLPTSRGRAAWVDSQMIPEPKELFSAKEGIEPTLNSGLEFRVEKNQPQHRKLFLKPSGEIGEGAWLNVQEGPKLELSIDEKKTFVVVGRSNRPAGKIRPLRAPAPRRED